jgi:hypothetical protein
MRKGTQAAVLTTLLVLMCVSPALCAPAIGGAWKGTTRAVAPGVCFPPSITLTIVQCGDTSNVIQGNLVTTLKSKSLTIPIIGKFRADGVTLDISGELWTRTSSYYYDFYQVTIIGNYLGGAPAKIQVGDMEILYGNTGSMAGDNNAIYDTCTLTKQ